MKNIKINAQNFNVTNNSINIKLPDNLLNIKIIDANLKIKVDTVSTTSNNFYVNYFARYYTQNLVGWENVDLLTNIKSNQLLTINISDELQDALNKKATNLVLNFVDDQDATVTFKQNSSNSEFLNIDYISLNEFQENTGNHSIDFETAGKLSVNLVTKEISLSTPLVSSDNNVLPLSITNNYCSTKKSSEILNSSKNNLNIQQYLIKHDDNDKLYFTYVDSNGKEQDIEEKYYYLEDDVKHYVSRSAIEVDLDGNLKYDNKEIKTSLESPSGLKLVSSIEDLKGAKLVDYKPEELANIENKIKQLKDYKIATELSIASSRFELCKMLISIECGEESDKQVTFDTFNDLKTKFENHINKNKQVLGLGCDSIYIFEQEVISNPSSFSTVLPNSFLEEFYNKLKDENGKVATKKYNLKFEELQLATYIKNIISQMEKLKEYNDQLKKCEHQKKLYDIQVPVHYLYDDSKIIYGFAKAEDKENPNIFRLVLITDPYENSIYITYKDFVSNEIEYITDSEKQTITFEYENSLLKKIIDSRERSVSFDYDQNNNIVSINHSDNKFAKFIYSEDNSLTGIIEYSGNGAVIEKTENDIMTIQEVSVRDLIKNNTFDWKNLSINQLKENAIKNKFVKINTNNYKSTTLTNGNNKSVTYIFDKYGKVKTVYENKFPDNFDVDSIFVTDFNYENDKICEKISSLLYSKNYLDNVCFDESSLAQTAGLYLGTAVCGEQTYPFTYSTCQKRHTILKNETNKVKSLKLSDDNINAINELNDDNHKVFILSGWAKADSTFIVSKDDTAEVDDYVKSRKFELKAIVKYDDNSQKEFVKCFDWRNIDWQYCAVPVKIEDNKVVSKIECLIDFSNNTGDISFTDPEFKECDCERVEYDEQKRPVKKYSAHSEWITSCEYDGDSNNIIKEIITSNKDNKLYFATTYEYNKQGKLLRTIDYNNIVKENVYNDKGLVEKSITYSKDEPTSKYYEENNLDEKGKSKGSVNEFGKKVCEYNYIPKTGIISEEIDNNGTKTAYGYDSDDTLIESSISVDGITNANTFGYELGLPTSIKHNDFEIKYDYDNESRLTKVSVADTDSYLSTEYLDNEQTTTFVSGESYRTTSNDDGNVLNTYYKSSPDAEEEQINENIYDSHGNLTYSHDFLANNERKIYIDKFGKTYKQEETQHGQKIVFENFYDDNHNNVQSSATTVKDKELFTYFNYSNTPDSKLESLELIDNSKKEAETILNQILTYDKLGRISKIESDKTSKSFGYLKHGDHTSNLVSKLSFSNNTSVCDNLTYKYDDKGNITQVRQNNILLARYKYDDLSRLLREDNKQFGKTTTYSYDAGGNIETKSEYNFTLVENLDFEVATTNNYCYNSNGWHDQLKLYNGQTFAYDALGNPIIFKDINLSWTRGRQLKQFGDIATYCYNSNGIRTSKTVGTVTTKFYLNGNHILRQEDSENNVLDFLYGADGLAGFTYNGTNYFYKKNIQNDIIGILDSAGKEIIRYNYDAWGNQRVIILSNGVGYEEFDPNKVYTGDEYEYNKIARINPFRYRSYYFDTETNLYYLNSRYYDPELGRFINSDDINTIDVTKVALNGLNLYAYCLNNPVNKTDATGLWWFFDDLIAAFTGFVVGIVGQLVSDLVTSAFTKKWCFSSWETYFGAALGGLVGGWASLYVGPVAGNAIGAGLSTFVGQSLESLTGTNVRSFGEILLNSLFSAGIGAITAGFTQFMKIPKITSGSHSFSQIWKSGLTKFAKYGFKISMKTMTKGFVSELIKNFSIGWLLNSIVVGGLEALKIKLKQKRLI